ncbi:hypothetical protein T484DRAFT_1649297, partial [Baffinella frigidus]
NPKSETRNPKPETRNPKHETWNPKPETRNPKPETRNPPHTRNPKPQTPNPQQVDAGLDILIHASNQRKSLHKIVTIFVYVVYLVIYDSTQNLHHLRIPCILGDIRLYPKSVPSSYTLCTW